MKKVLFILKKRGTPYYQSEVSTTTYGSFSSGLFNSVRFINDMLQDHHVDSKMVEVTDNNDIDREVTRYRPDIVVIEALWVVPSKFDVLKKLHPNVHWVVRIHSEIPFIANEGVAMEWIFGYAAHDKVSIAPNTERMCTDIANMLSAKYTWEEVERKVVYLPNYYSNENLYEKEYSSKHIIDVGCFGAVRPLKNQLIQALAAIKYAKTHKKKLRFHINGTRVEYGNNVLKNIKNLFENLDPMQFELVEHHWLNHEEFVKLIAQMDIGLQVSFSETFNIVTADFVSQNVPIVTSSEMSWMHNCSFADTTDTQDIVDTMTRILKRKGLVTFINRIKLKAFNNSSKKVWLTNLK
jgi:hypothetical protein